MPNSPASILLGVYKDAVYHKDINAFMQLYDAQVQVFDTWAVWSYNGAEAWRKAIEQWFRSLGSGQVRVTMQDVHIRPSSELLVLTAIFTYTECSPQGVELRSMQNRLTWVLVAQDNSWKVIHEHSSAPLGVDDGKGILEC